MRNSARLKMGFLPSPESEGVNPARSCREPFDWPGLIANDPFAQSKQVCTRSLQPAFKEDHVEFETVRQSAPDGTEVLRRLYVSRFSAESSCSRTFLRW